MTSPTAQPVGPSGAVRDDGATAVEYALMVALIALVIFGGVFLLGPNLDLIFDEAAASL
ncbi:Flp family type IVb pilin [Knoellia flava]|uniref:Flp family type IVb pilin n=1 Tax=Knoellia flava TaxID=913969 RepID=UPI0009FE0EF9|nr:Flp family type IVb pilin [Knoellia flava]